MSNDRPTVRFVIVAMTLAAAVHCTSSHVRPAAGAPSALALCGIGPGLDTTLSRSWPAELKSVMRRNPDYRAAVADAVSSIVTEYRKRQYSDAEILAALHSLGHLIHEEQPVLSSFSPATGTHVMPGADDAVHIYVDPTCDECQRVVMLILTARSRCGAEAFPSIEFGLLPARDARSIEAATAIETLYRTDREEALPVLLDFVMQLPHSHAPIDELIPPELGLRAFRELPSFPAAKKAVEDLVRSDFARAHTAPVVIFRERHIKRDTTFTTPFDPFRDETNLIATINLIRLADHAERPVKSHFGRRSNDAEVQK